MESGDGPLFDLPVFLSYRREDGAPLARQLHGALDGRVIAIPQARGPISPRLSVYLDVGSIAAPDWEQQILDELRLARALVVVCTPGARSDFGSGDWFFKEIRWWCDNRPDAAPILVSNVGPRWIPEPISEQWPKAQVVALHQQPYHSSSLASADQSMPEDAVQRVLGSLVTSLSGQPLNLISVGMSSVPGLYTWKKDRHLKYIECSDTYAAMAGFDSPHAMRGKTDDRMPWRELADAFRVGDHLIISGRGPPRLQVREKEIMVDRVADILVTESQLLDRFGRCIGVQGFFLDITDCRLLMRTDSQANPDGTYCLGTEFDNAVLTRMEAAVLRGMIRTYTIERIASAAGVPRCEVEASIRSIKRKMQCVTDGDVIEAAVRAALPFLLFGPAIVHGSGRK